MKRPDQDEVQQALLTITRLAVWSNERDLKQHQGSSLETATLHRIHTMLMGVRDQIYMKSCPNALTVAIDELIAKDIGRPPYAAAKEQTNG